MILKVDDLPLPHRQHRTPRLPYNPIGGYGWWFQFRPSSRQIDPLHPEPENHHLFSTSCERDIATFLRLNNADKISSIAEALLLTTIANSVPLNLVNNSSQ